MADDSKKSLIEGLNEDLRGEFQAVIMYRIYASMPMPIRASFGRSEPVVGS